jgi:hypothetical protein
VGQNGDETADARRWTQIEEGKLKVSLFAFYIYLRVSVFICGFMGFSLSDQA